MQKYTAKVRIDSHDMDAEVYLASEADDVMAGASQALNVAKEQIRKLRGALADIAFSDDMTLEVARAKAKRIYESTAN